MDNSEKNLPEQDRSAPGVDSVGDTPLSETAFSKTAFDETPHDGTPPENEPPAETNDGVSVEADNENPAAIITDGGSPDGAGKPSRKRLLDREYAYLLFAFLISAAIMYIIYAAMEIRPFGDGSVLVLDLNGQYVYFFEALRDMVWGENSILYTFQRALGGEFMGIYAYYIASPLSYIVALFPKERILEALLCIFLIKCGLCGFTFGFYLHKSSKNINKIAIIAFSIMYALCAYAVVQQHNTMWIDALIWLPLLTLGIEELIKRKKYKLFVVSLAMTILSNFYIGFMICIYAALYFFYYFYANNENNSGSLNMRNNPGGERVHFTKTLWRMAFFSALAVGIAMVIIWPAYYSLTFGKTTFSDPNYALFQQFDFLDLASKLFAGSYDTVRPEGLPFIYCGTLTLILLPLFFLSSRFTAREKIFAGAFISIFVISFNASTLDIFWHGMQRPNWLNYRYSFMLCFFMLVLAYRAYEHIRETNPRTIVAVCAAYTALIIVMQKLGYENLPAFEAVWFSIFCLGMYLIVLCLSVRTEFVENTATILTVLICLEMFCAGLSNTVALGDDVIYSSYSSYNDYIGKYQPVVDAVKELDSSFYRMEKTDHRKTNDPMALGFRGLSGSTSTLNAATIEFLARMGYSSKSHWSKYLGGNPISDSLLGLKYIISSTPPSDRYEMVYDYEEQNLRAYYNPYALPVAFAVDSAINEVLMVGVSEAESDGFLNPYERLNAMITAMLGESKTVQVFVPIKEKTVDTDNCETSYIAGHIKYYPVSQQKDAYIYYKTTAAINGEIFFYLPSMYAREIGVRVNGRVLEGFYGHETTRILSLGSFAAGDEVRLTMSIMQDDLYVLNRGYCFYYIDYGVFEDVMARLAEGGFSIDDYTEDRLTGTIEVPHDGMTVLTTIAYDEGWIVELDGERAETYMTLDALLAFDANAGSHTLELRYRPKSFTYGLAISAASLAVFIAVCAIGSVRKRSRAAVVEAAPKNENNL